ncbi:MAG: tetratricopeptide repeat protein [Planctomycetes bacterium]|nr:tetratricopeptide repeat protein [Planctomycetota bacterium]
MPSLDSAPKLAAQLPNALPNTVEELEAARLRVLGESDFYRSFEASFYESSPTEPTDDAGKLKAGTCRYLLGQEARALELIGTQKGEVPTFIRARVALGRGDAQRALKEIAAILDKKPACLPARLVRADALAQLSDSTSLEKELKELQKNHGDSADAPYVLGLLREIEGEYDEAVRAFQQALAIEATHVGALFRLAYHQSLRGDTESAIDLYERLCNQKPAPVGALLNLGILFEDDEDYQLARNCFQRILDFDPNHPRARLYLQDVSASSAQYYDEERKRNEDKHAAVLGIPITDFELSVRSRNCLANMNVRTLGDLISLSEPELLAFKNFGETSLTEIKQILNQKGLTLGMLPPKPDSNIGLRALDVDKSTAIHKPVGELDLSVRSRRALETLGVRTLGELIGLSELQLLSCKNFGQTSLMEIKKKLEAYGLALKQE